MKPDIKTAYFWDAVFILFILCIDQISAILYTCKCVYLHCVGWLCILCIHQIAVTIHTNRYVNSFLRIGLRLRGVLFPCACKHLLVFVDASANVTMNK